MYKQLRDTLLLGEMRPAGTESDEVLHRHPPDYSHTQTVSPHVCVCILCIVSWEEHSNIWPLLPSQRSPFTHLPSNCRHIFGAMCPKIKAALLFADSYLLCFTDCIHHLSYSVLALFYVKRCLYKPLLQLTFPGTHSKRYLFTWVKKEKSYTSNWFLLYFLGKVWDEGLAKS